MDIGDDARSTILQTRMQVMEGNLEKMEQKMGMIEDLLRQVLVQLQVSAMPMRR